MRRFVSRAGFAAPVTAMALGATVVAAMAILGGGRDASAVTTPASSTTSRVVGDSDNGRTVSVPVGDVVVVRLSADNWTISPSTNPAVLRMTGTQRQRRSPRCVPGGTCGTTTASFTALQKGVAVLRASRNYCGEAIRCTPATDSWSVTVDVIAH